MIDKEWMNSFAYEVKICPKCHQKSLCLIFTGMDGTNIWECAESNCGYNSSASQRRFK